MNPAKYQYHFLLLLSLLLSGCSNPPLNPVQVKLKIGDQPLWSQQSLDDRNWANTNGTAYKGIFWLRFKMNLPQNKQANTPYGVQIITLGSYEAYWDGQLIGKNGIVASRKSAEIPGLHSKILLLHDSLSSAGNHVLALRVSNFHYQRSYSFFNARAGQYQTLMTRPLLMAILMAVLAGAFLTAALYYLFQFVHHPSERLFLVFSIICSLFFCLLFIEYLPVFWAYPYPFQLIRLELIGLLTLGIAYLIPYFLNRQLGSFRPILFNLTTGAVLLAFFAFYHGRYDFSAQLLGLVMGISSLLVAILAVYRRVKGGWLVTLAILSAALATGFLYFDYSLYLSFGFLLLVMLYLLSQRSKAIEQAYRQTLLLSERLKTELLRKSIQPHFLMNTLTSLIELVEQSPQNGVKMIEALAAEMKILSGMADQTLVPLTAEIELCSFHLQVMHFRKGIDYQWQNNEIPADEYLPPTIIHTLLENGITHSKPLPNGSIHFKFNFEKTPEYKVYQLHINAINRIKTKTSGKGTGMKYIEARLKDMYGDRWTLNAEPTTGGWLTTIKIRS